MGALRGYCCHGEDRRVVELIDHYVEEFLVACHFNSVDDGFKWAFASVYTVQIWTGILVFYGLIKK